MCELSDALRTQAQKESDASKLWAQAKSLRQHDCDPPRDDLYMWTKPDKTISWKAADELDARAATIEALEAENAKLKTPQWFYPDDEGEYCFQGPWDVIDWYDLPAGKHVMKVDCGKPLPSFWCAVHVLTHNERDALETDEDFLFTEHPTLAEAEAALAKEPTQ